jgi:hypothetical protein
LKDGSIGAAYGKAVRDAVTICEDVLERRGCVGERGSKPVARSRCPSRVSGGVVGLRYLRWLGAKNSSMTSGVHPPRTLSRRRRPALCSFPLTCCPEPVQRQSQRRNAERPWAAPSVAETAVFPRRSATFGRARGIARGSGSRVGDPRARDGRARDNATPSTA